MPDTPQRPMELAQRWPQGSVRRRLLGPFIAIEWILEWLDYWFSHFAIFKVLASLAQLGVIVGVYSYVTGADERRAQRHYQAWQVITGAFGQPGNGGRINALQDLHRDRVSLAGVDISSATLQGLQLSRADLRGARLVGTVLVDSNLAGANLEGADLTGATITNTDLRGADLDRANLSRALIYHSLIDAASFDYAQMVQTCLMVRAGRPAEFRMNQVDAREAQFFFDVPALSVSITWSDLRGSLLSGYVDRPPMFGPFDESNLYDARGYPDTAVRAVRVSDDATWDDLRLKAQGFPMARRVSLVADGRRRCPEKTPVELLVGFKYPDRW